MEGIYPILENLGLKSHHLDKFCQMVKIKTLHKKEYLIEEGAVCTFLGIVKLGTLRSFVQANGEEFNNDFYFRDNYISAYTSFLTQQPTSCTIQAITDAQIYYITRHQLDELIKEDNEWLKLSKSVAELFFIRKCKRETTFLKNTATERLESVLSIYPGIEQQVPQYHIASYMGIKPESLSRIKALTYINK